MKVTEKTPLILTASNLKGSKEAFLKSVDTQLLPTNQFSAWVNSRMPDHPPALNPLARGHVNTWTDKSTQPKTVRIVQLEVAINKDLLSITGNPAIQNSVAMCINTHELEEIWYSVKPGYRLPELTAHKIAARRSFRQAHNLGVARQLRALQLGTIDWIFNKLEKTTEATVQAERERKIVNLSFQRYNK